MIIASSWSGGKDSCFACYKAKLSGHDIKYLLNFISEEYGRVSFHGTSKNVIKAQSDAIGIRLFQKSVNRNNYEEKFKEAIAELKDKGIEGVVFGDIDLEEHKKWVERVCGEIGIAAIEPLWLKVQRDILNEFIKEGFEAIVTSADSKFFDEGWLGRMIDERFLKDIEALNKEKGVTPCGEMGEYHTLVINGPFFKKRLDVVKTIKVLKDGFWFQDTSLSYAIPRKASSKF